MSRHPKMQLVSSMFAPGDVCRAKIVKVTNILELSFEATIKCVNESAQKRSLYEACLGVQNSFIECGPMEGELFGVCGQNGVHFRAVLPCSVHVPNLVDTTVYAPDWGRSMRLQKDDYVYMLSPQQKALHCYGLKCQLVAVEDLGEFADPKLLQKYILFYYNKWVELRLLAMDANEQKLYVEFVNTVFDHMEKPFGLFLREHDKFNKSSLLAVSSVDRRSNTVYFRKGQCFDVTVTCVVDGLHFFGIPHQANQAQPYQIVWDDLTFPFGPQVPETWKPLVFDLVAARHFDGKWYRAKIIQYYPSTRLFRVFYVDYGNEGMVKKTALHPLPPFWYNQPFCAVLFSIAGVVSDCNYLTSKYLTTNLLRTECLKKTLTVKVINVQTEKLVVSFVDYSKIEWFNLMLAKGYFMAKIGEAQLQQPKLRVRNPQQYRQLQY